VPFVRPNIRSEKQRNACSRRAIPGLGQEDRRATHPAAAIVAAKPKGERARAANAAPKRERTQRSLWRGYETKRAWAYALTNDGITQFDLRDWQRHREHVDFVLRTIRAAFRLRHDPHVGKFARLALKAQFAALAVFDPEAPDFGAAAFDLAFERFRGEWNALVAAYAKDQPRRAALQKRLMGDATRNDVATRWNADEKSGKPERGRVGRVAADLGRPCSTVRDAALALGLIAPKKTRSKR